METTYDKYIGINKDIVISTANVFSKCSDREVEMPSLFELGMLGFVVVLFFIPFIWYVCHSTLFSIY
jgi:hypothetical protein